MLATNSKLPLSPEPPSTGWVQSNFPGGHNQPVSCQLMALASGKERESFKNRQWGALVRALEQSLGWTQCIGLTGDPGSTLPVWLWRNCLSLLSLGLFICVRDDNTVSLRNLDETLKYFLGKEAQEGKTHLLNNEVVSPERLAMTTDYFFMENY